MKIFFMLLFGVTLSVRGSELFLDSIYVGENMDLSGPDACQLDDGQLFMSHLIGGVNRFDFSENKFVLLGVPEMQYYISIFQNPLTRRVFVGGRGQLAYSDDLGKTWSLFPKENTPQIDFENVWAHENGSIYVATGDNAAVRPGYPWGVYRSDDNGESWYLVQEINCSHNDIFVDEEGTIFLGCTGVPYQNCLYIKRESEVQFRGLFPDVFLWNIRRFSEEELILGMFHSHSVLFNKNEETWKTPKALREFRRTENVLKTKNGYLWITQEEWQDEEFWYISKDLTTKTHISSNHTTFEEIRGRVLFALTDKEGHLWIAKQTYGVYRSRVPFEQVVGLDESETNSSTYQVKYESGVILTDVAEGESLKISLFDVAGRIVASSSQVPFRLPSRVTRNLALFWLLEIDGEVHTGSLYID